MVDNTEKYIPTLNLYCSLMEEIKRRQSVVSSILAQTIPLPKIVACELCYLQIRMICELIALGCLGAHGDIAGTRSGRMQKAYAVDWIMNALEALHPKFYPQPSYQILNAKGRPVEVKPKTTGFLTKAEMLILYHECGSFLHRGSLKSVLANHPRNPNFDVIRDWDNKIIELLNHHQIQLSDPETMMWVLMQSKESGRVGAWIFQRAEPTPG